MRRILVVALTVAALGPALGATAAGASQEPATSYATPTLPTIAPVIGTEPASSTAAPKPAEPAIAVPTPKVLDSDPLSERVRSRLATEMPRLSPADKEDRAALAAFYLERGGRPVWYAREGISKRGQAVVDEIRRADDWGLKASAFELPGTPRGAIDSAAFLDEIADAEIRLGMAILKYARHARGARLDPGSLSKYLDRDPVLYEPKGVIEGIAASEKVAAYLHKLHPQHPQFEKLRQKYLTLRSGGTVAQASPVEQPAAHGRDGKGQRKKALGAPEPGSARKVLANLEQWRWMPDQLGDLHVWVNVPEYLVRVVKNGQVIHTERIVAGKTDTQTPIFSARMQYVIFHPDWGVPDSIKVKEILPGLRSGSGGWFGGSNAPAVLARHNLRVSYNGRPVDPGSVNWNSVDVRAFTFIQPPGATNVLGVVKFRFPNKHDVYMHDTPTKHLFGASVRTFSHGCMRVQNPVRLAEILLQEDKGWPAERVRGMVSPAAQQNNSITLARQIPVHVTYFTATVDDDGKARFFGDVYGHEERIGYGLDGKAHLIVRKPEETSPVRAAPIERLADNRPTSAGDWARRAFGGGFGGN